MITVRPPRWAVTTVCSPIVRAGSVRHPSACSRSPVRSSVFARDVPDGTIITPAESPESAPPSSWTGIHGRRPPIRGGRISSGGGPEDCCDGVRRGAPGGGAALGQRVVPPQPPVDRLLAVYLDQAGLGQPVERGVEGAGPQPAPVRGERLDLAHHAIPVQGSGRERGEDEKRGFLYGHPTNVPTIGISRQS